jgi:NAD kinase
LALDGTEDKILQENDKIILTAAPHPFLLLWPQDLSFYQVLQQKLGWKGLPEEGDF